MQLIKHSLLIPALLICAMAQTKDVHSSDSLVRAMHDRYAATWYQTITFTETNTSFKPDGTAQGSETWYNAGVIPGKWRIDLVSPTSGNGYVMVNGTMAVVQKDKVLNSQPHFDLLDVLGFDIYRQSPEATIKILKNEGFDLSKFHEDTWEGKPTYVVGADKGDGSSKQFWVDEDKLLFLREIEPVPTDPEEFHDIRITHYSPLAGGWFANSVEVYTWEGKKFFVQEYSDVHADVKLDPGVFDAQQFKETHWEK
jgi:hypothetical protein